MPWLPRRAVFTLVVILATSMLLVACGGDDDGADAALPSTTQPGEAEADDTPSTSSNCPLTTDDVRAVVGRDVEQVDIGVGCRFEYEATDDATGSMEYADVTYTPLPASALSEEALEDVGAEPVVGIGDEAYTVLPNSLLVAAGEAVFELEVDTNEDDAADLAFAEELAAIVIAAG